MPFVAPPAAAAWQHRDARSGFEVVFFHPLGDGYRVAGSLLLDYPGIAVRAA